MLKIAFNSDQSPQELTIERVEELFGLSYYPHLEYANWKIEHYVRSKCKQAHKKGKIEEAALWLGTLHAEKLASPFIPDVTIQWIHESIGYGVFTNRAISKWGFIGEYTGLLRRRNLMFPDLNDYCFMYPRKWWTSIPLTIDSEKQGNFTRFINHSDIPNCESVSVLYDGTFHIMFRAIRAISAGEQLTYDYGGLYWRRRDKWANDGSRTRDLRNHNPTL
ncbi:MAG: hypothetical protein S4CHLAM123_02750 [Chlamydiales bacterium]|nr:hypothetical protein [Chlamydiales bacterium]